jgi:hypothetical protein
MTEINELITVPEIEEAIEVDAPAEAEVSEEPPPKRPRGRPKGKAKPKEPPAKRVIQKVYETRPPQLDMNALTHMLAEHLATEKQTARAKRHDAWGGFF